MNSGSAFVDSWNSSRASSNQKECNAATPRRKCAFAGSEPVVGKSTFPSFECCAIAPVGAVTRISGISETQQSFCKVKVSRMHSPPNHDGQLISKKAGQQFDQRPTSLLIGRSLNAPVVHSFVA